MTVMRTPPSTREGPGCASRPEPEAHLDELDGLRGVAVLLVLLFHVGGTTLFPGGFLGVDVFFVLSGYLITTILAGQLDSGGISFRRFYARRLRRLLPALLLVSGAVIAYVLILDPTGESPEQADRTLLGALTSLGYVSNIVLAAEGAGTLGLMGHSWSLSVEEHFYLLWPVLLLCLARLTRTREQLALAVSGLTVLAVSVPFLLLSSGSGTERVYFGTDTRAYYLLAGCLLGLLLGDEALRARVAWVFRPWLAATALGVLLIGTLLFDRSGGAYYAGGAVLVVAASVWLTGVLVLRPTTCISRLFAARPLVAIGTWSYGLYLWHYPMFLAAYDVIGTDTELRRTMARVIATAVSFAVAWASFRFLENPISVDGWRAPFRRGRVWTARVTTSNAWTHRAARAPRAHAGAAVPGVGRLDESDGELEPARAGTGVAA